MKKIKVEAGEPFQVVVTINKTDYFKQTLKITSLNGEQIILEFRKPCFRMTAKIEQADSLYIKKSV